MNKEIRAWSYVIIASTIISLIASLFFHYPFISSLRAILGAIYVLFLPGYVVVRLFFNEIDWIEKAALSMGLSIALVILSVMFSNMLLKIPITPLSNFLVILAVIIITFLIKRYQENINTFFNKLFKKRK